MNLAAIGATFPVVALGELPDKTMFASLLLAARGRPFAVWVGAVAAFAVHVAIAVAVGGVLVALVPRRALDVVVAVAFLAAAAWAWRAPVDDDDDLAGHGASSPLRVAGLAAGTIFVAEWGDLTQVLTVQLAARFDPLSVGVGALAALAAVAGVAVGAGSQVLRFVSVRVLRRVTAVVLVGLAAWALVDAAG